MGLFDTVVLLDQKLTCLAGHSVGVFQTKSFPEPSMSTYLVEEGRLVRAAPSSWGDEDERSAWRISGNEAIHERCYALEPVSLPFEVDMYTHCHACEPILVRVEAARAWGDIVHEHRVPVDFRLTLSEGGPLRIERVSGDREQLLEELRRDGLRVLGDDDPLAVAHREIRRARDGRVR